MIALEIEHAIALVETTAATSLFGSDPKKVYRDLSKLIHPDLVEPKLKDRAAKAFSKLSAMYAALNGKKAPATEKIIGKWIVSTPIAKGDLCDLYEAEHVDSKQRGVFKIARSPKDSDLMEQEYVSLGMLHTHAGGDNFKKYLPKVLDRVEASGRRANILTVAEDTHSLEYIVSLQPHLDAKHLVWMCNRALSVLGFIHECGIVHGSVLPSHLLYGPTTHSLTLVDWCYSVSAESKKHIPAIAKAYAHLYPAEVSRKVPAHPATDVYMLFASLKATGAKIPKRLKPVFEWAMASSPKSRPQNAWELQDRFLAIAKEEYGEPKYVKLELTRQ